MDGFRSKIGSRVITVGLWIGAVTGPVRAETLITADNPLINYYGRWDFTDPKVPQFEWVGTSLEASFTGTSIGIQMTEVRANIEYTSDARFEAEIDDGPAIPIPLTSGMTKYAIKANLANGTHKIRVVLRNETWNVLKKFGGFYLADGQTLVPLPKKARKIEFLGDSWTAGYGDEPTSNCDLALSSNANSAYAARVSKAFRAQSSIVAMSGNGFTNEGFFTHKMMQDYFDETYPFYQSRKWDFSKWIPDLFVIALGINDFGKASYSDSVWKSTYKGFINDKVLARYPNVKLLLVKPNMPPDAYSRLGSNAIIDQIVSEVKAAGHAAITSVPFPDLSKDPNGTYVGMKGCNWHPDSAQQKRIASAVIAKVVSDFGWDTSAVTGLDRKSGTPLSPSLDPLPGLAVSNRRLTIRPIGKSRITIHDIHGGIRAAFDSADALSWSAPTAGVYFVTFENTRSVERRMVLIE